MKIKSVKRVVNFAEMRELMNDPELSVMFASKGDFGYVLLKNKLEGSITACRTPDGNMVTINGSIYPGIYPCKMMLRDKVIKVKKTEYRKRIISGILTFFQIKDADGNSQSYGSYIMVFESPQDNNTSFDPKKEKQSIKLGGQIFEKASCQLVLPRSAMKILFTNVEV